MSYSNMSTLKSCESRHILKILVVTILLADKLLQKTDCGLAIDGQPEPRHAHFGDKCDYNAYKAFREPMLQIIIQAYGDVEGQNIAMTSYSEYTLKARSGEITTYSYVPEEYQDVICNSPKNPLMCDEKDEICVCLVMDVSDTHGEDDEKEEAANETMRILEVRTVATVMNFSVPGLIFNPDSVPVLPLVAPGGKESKTLTNKAVNVNEQAVSSPEKHDGDQSGRGIEAKNPKVEKKTEALKLGRGIYISKPRQRKPVKHDEDEFDDDKDPMKPLRKRRRRRNPAPDPSGNDAKSKSGEKATTTTPAPSSVTNTTTSVDDVTTTTATTTTSPSNSGPSLLKGAARGGSLMGQITLTRCMATYNSFCGTPFINCLPYRNARGKITTECIYDHCSSSPRIYLSFSQQGCKMLLGQFLMIFVRKLLWGK